MTGHSHRTLHSLPHSPTLECEHGDFEGGESLVSFLMSNIKGRKKVERPYLHVGIPGGLE